MLIVDAQIHLWSSGTPLAHHKRATFSQEEALAEMDEAGVGRAIICPVAWDPNSVNLGREAALAHPRRFGTFGWFPPNQPESRQLVPAWLDQPNMFGLRFFFSQSYDRTWPMDGTLDWLWPAAEAAGVPIALQAAEFLPLVGEIALRYPRLRLIIDHLSAARATKGEAAFANVPTLVTLAKYPNIAVKATGLPGNATDGYPFRGTHEPLRKVYDAFGPHRLFWGTDLTRLPCSYRQAVTMFTEELPWLPEPDKELVMGRALCEWINWPVSPAGPR